MRVSTLAPVVNASALVLLPRPLPAFIVREQAEDLLRSPGVSAVAPPRVPYGLVARAPAAAERAIARLQAARVQAPGDLRAIVFFHPLQLPLARELAAGRTGCELWYGCWDRYEFDHAASTRVAARVAALHREASRDADLVFAVSDELARLQERAGDVVVVSQSADTFPVPPPATITGVSLGHLGPRTDWELLARITAAVPELVLLMVGARHDDQCAGDRWFERCRDSEQFLWLGRLDDAPAARAIACADFGLVPFKRDPLNDAGLPTRILKYARVGRRTLSPVLAGVRTWGAVVTECATIDDWVAAIRAQAGVRERPHEDVRAWALQQTAEHSNAPLWARLAALGVPGPIA